jgi:hypothetical protein
MKLGAIVYELHDLKLKILNWFDDMIYLVTAIG